MTVAINTFDQKSTFVSNLIATERGKNGIVSGLKCLLVEAGNSGIATGYDLEFYENYIRR